MYTLIINVFENDPLGKRIRTIVEYFNELDSAVNYVREKEIEGIIQRKSQWGIYKKENNKLVEVEIQEESVLSELAHLVMEVLNKK